MTSGPKQSVLIDGNIYLTGVFYDTQITLDTIQLANNIPLNYHAFLARYDASGNVLWAKISRGEGEAWGYSLCLDINNNLIANIGSNGYESIDIDSAAYSVTPYADPLLTVVYVVPKVVCFVTA